MHDEKNTLLFLMRKNKTYIILFSSFFAAFLVLSCQKKEIFTKSIEVCPHYNCADATVIQVTDQYFPPKHRFVRDDSRKYSAVWAEFLAFKYNVPLHVFEQNVKGEEFRGFLQTGRGGASIYYPSCHFEYRQSKLDSIKAEIENVTCRTISTLSYGCGKTKYSDSLPNYILGGRNSKFMSLSNNTEANTWYGEGVSAPEDFNILNRSAGGRFYTDIQRNNQNLAQAGNYVTEQVSKTVANGGFYTNFMHWHDHYNNKNDSLIEGVTVMQPLFKAMQKGMKNSRNAGLDYNEAIEYLYAKEAIDSVQILESTSSVLKIEIQLSKKRNADYSVIDTPVTFSVRKDAMEAFEIDEVDLNTKLLSVFEDDDRYYLNIMLDFTQSEIIVTLHSKKDRVEILELEEALRVSKRWFVNGVKASEPSKFILFRREQGAKEYEIEIVHRTVSFSEKYDLPELDEGYDYFCGAIDKKKESTLIEL